MTEKAMTFRAGPVADRISIWPMENGSYGLDATFQGASGLERLEKHEATTGVRHLAEGVPANLDTTHDNERYVNSGSASPIDCGFEVARTAR